MMTLNPDIPADDAHTIPSITISESVSGNNLEFPDKYAYFILSEAGKEYTYIAENETILLNPQKGYFTPPFNLQLTNTQVQLTARHLFGGTKPIDGKAKEALELSLKRAGKPSPSLKNRL